jgi:hypothetical protein
MLKSGLIIGVVMLVLTIGVALITPLCVPCLALLAGAGAGYLASVFDKPSASGASAQTGAGAGAIGGVGALIGHLAGGVANVILVGPEGAADLLQGLGLPTSSAPTGYYAGTIGGTCCFGLVEVLLMAGLGALGGLLWYQIAGKNVTTSSGM